MTAQMTPELTALALVALWQFVMVALAGAALNRDAGVEWNASPRDGEGPALSPRTGRLRRAVANHVENLGLFITAVLVVQLSGANSSLTAACAWIFLAARLLYLPAYALGWTPWRSLIWALGAIATIVMLLAALL